MIRQVFKIKFPGKSYMNYGSVDGHGITCLVSKNILSQKRLYSAGSSSPGKRLKKIVYTTGALALGTGGLVLYAQNDANFQSWLNDNIPGYKSIFKGENLFQVYIFDPVLSFKDMVVENTFNLIGQGESDSGSAKTKETSQVETIKRDTPSVLATKSEGSLIATPASIIELEKVITTTAQECIQSYNSVVNVFKDYDAAVQRLVDNSFHEIDSRLWTDIGKKQEEKQKLVYITEAKIEAAMKLIDKMELLLQDTTLPTASDIKQRVVKKMNQIMDDIQKIKKNIQNEILTSSITKKHWKDLQEARTYFFEELDNLIPNKDLYDTKVHLSEDELNLFLIFAYQKILYYQNELRKFEASKDKELNYSLSGLKEDEVVDMVVQTVMEKERRKLQEDFEKKELALLLEAKRRTRHQVKLQAEAHYDILREAMLNKEEEMKRKFRRELENKVDELKTEGKINIASMVGRLKGYNDAVKKRLLEKKQSRDAQELWCACQTLRNSIELPRITKPSVNQLKPLKTDIKNIIRSSEGDEFVTTVASTIPKVALDRGVYPKMTLRDRFLKVERVASRLAQVDESELSLPKMFVSWLQSFLIIKNIDPITNNELANEPVDVSSFSTHDILHRARFWLDRGDFLQAVQYMNLLTGAPKAVAKDWIEEATILLETIQAADTLLAHACAGSFKKNL